MNFNEVHNPFNAPVFYEQSVSSTMDVCRKLAANGEPHGTVIVADFQDRGRGRQGRTWMTGEVQSLLFTIFLDFKNFSDIPKALTLKTGLAVALAIEDLVPVLAGSNAVLVKWPNDVIFDGRKAAGILTESDGARVFIGIGVNVTQTEFPQELKSKAVSIKQVYPDLHSNARSLLLEKILLHLFNEIYKNAITGDELNIAAWRERITNRLYKKNENVEFAEGPADSQNIIKGVLTGIGPEGELLIIPEGQIKERSFYNGELRVYE